MRTVRCSGSLSCHTCHPLPCMPPATRSPSHACLLLHMPPHAMLPPFAIHAPSSPYTSPLLPCTPPFTMHGPLCHACPPPFTTHTCPFTTYKAWDHQMMPHQVKYCIGSFSMHWDHNALTHMKEKLWFCSSKFQRTCRVIVSVLTTILRHSRIRGRRGEEEVSTGDTKLS